MNISVEKRFLSLLLAFIMVFSLFPWWTLDVGAASYKTETGSIGNIGYSVKVPITSDKKEDLGSFNVNGNTINASAKSEYKYDNGGCFSDPSVTFTATTITITLTNNSGSDAVIGFLFDGGSTVTVSGVSIGTGGNYVSPKLEHGASIEIAMKSPATGTPYVEQKYGVGDTFNLNLNDIYLQIKETVTIEYDAVANGTYTVDGVSVQEKSSKQIDTTQDIVLVATPADGYVFAGWKNLTTGKYFSFESSVTTKFSSNASFEPSFVWGGDVAWAISGSQYATLDDALAAVTPGYTITQIKETVTLTKNYTIPAAVTLFIPCDTEYTVCTDQPNVMDSYIATPTPFRTLVLANNVKLTVQGNICVEGSQAPDQGYNGAPTGPVGFIRMASGSEIILESGANLYAWGYITTDGINGEGTVTAKNGASVYECFQMMDFRGGSCLALGTSISDGGLGGIIGGIFGDNGMINNTKEVFPMSQYYIQNIEVPLTLNAGAVERAYMSTNAGGLSGSEIAGAIIPIISGSSESMFQLTSGTISKDFNESTGRIEFEIHNGALTVNSINMSMKLMGVQQTLNSANFILPIPGHMSVTASGNSTVIINQDIALFPGSEFVIEEGVHCTLPSGYKIIVYDADDWGGYCSSVNVPFCPLVYAPGRASVSMGNYDDDPNKRPVSLSGVPVDGLALTPDVEKDYGELGIHLISKAVMNDATVRINGTIDASGGAVYTTSGGANIYTTGSGVVITKPGTETTTYQATQAASTPSYLPITITPAVMRDGNGDAFETAGVEGTSTYNYCTESGHNKWYNINSTDSTTVTPPTCVDVGYTTVACKCGSSYKTAEVPATGIHTPGDAVVENTVAETCGKDGSYDSVVYCTVCSQELSRNKITVPATGKHTEVIDAVVPATCTATGLTEGKHCSVCNAVLVAQNVTAALGHTFETVGAKAPTCSATGNIEHKKCTACSKFFAADAANDSTAGNDTAEAFNLPIVPTAHKWESEFTVDKKATCTEVGQKSYHCEYCDTQNTESVTEIAKRAHNYVDTTVNTAPTCQLPGTMNQKCAHEASDEYEACTSTTTRVIDKDPNAHGWETEYTVDQKASCFQTGKMSYHCAYCDVINPESVVTIEVREHNFVDTTVEEPSTCTVDGIMNQKCDHAASDEYLACNATTTRPYKDPNAHKWATTYTVDWKATCDADGQMSYHCVYCGVVNTESAVAIEKRAHVYKDNGVHTAATCSAEGVMYTICTNIETDTHKACTHESTREIPIDPNAHKWETTYTVDKKASCSEAGQKSYHCEYCNTINEASKVVIEQRAHDLKDTTVQLAATCSAAGIMNQECVHEAIDEYEACDYTTTREIAINPSAHEWDNPSYTWLGKECQAERVCKHNNAHKESAYADGESVTSSVKIPATCEVAGTTTYTAVFDGVEWTVPQKMDLQDISALGHKWSVSYAWTQEADKWICTATHTCANSDSCTETKKVEASSGVKTPATCTVDGWTTYTATFEATWAKTQTREEQDIPAIAHKNKVHHAKVDATCVATGVIEYWSCPDCGKNFSDEACTTEVTKLTIEIDSNNHDLKTTDAKAPTCEDIGWDEYVTCQREGCGHTTYVEITALGHDYDETKNESNLTRPVKNGDTWSDGYYTFTCKNDPSHTKTESVKRADYTAYEAAKSELESLLALDLTAEAKAEINNVLAANELDDNLIEAEKISVDTATANLTAAYNAYKNAFNSYTVNFVVNGETVKTETVVSGGKATAPENPAKSYDGTYHYSFSGWDNAFDNVTADVTVTAQFTSIAHTFTSHTDKDDTVHTDKCACGYETDVAHSYNSGVVTTPSTCIEKGVKTFTCSLCSGTRTEEVDFDAANHASKDYEYVDNDNGTHIKKYACCEVVIESSENHIYNAVGECACTNKAEAKLGGTYYYKFVDAVAAAANGQTVTLCRDAVGSGVVIDKSITIDFGGYTYTFNCPVGSSGTETLGFQIFEGNSVTLKNGTLTANDGTNANGKVTKVLVQNYANLTVDNMNLIGNDNIQYCLSNNSGEINITGNTTITATGDNVAFDVYYYEGYEAPVVNVNTTGKITGKIEVSESINDNLNISNGTYTFEIKPEWCADTYEVTYNSADGTYGVKKHYVAAIGDIQYTSLKDAVDAAKPGETITLLGNDTGSGVVIDKAITVDFKGYTYTVNSPVGSAGTETLGFQILADGVTLKNGALAANDGTNEHGKVTKVLIMTYADLNVDGLTLRGNSNILYCLSVNSGTVTVNNSTIIATAGNVAFDACKYSSYEIPNVILTNTNVTGKVELTGGNVTLESGTYNADFDVQLGELTVKGGSYSTNVTEYCVPGDHTAPDGNLYTYGAHDYSSVYTAPTFDADGFTTYTCICGDVYVTTEEGSQKIAVAKIGDVRYESLAEAVAAAQENDTILLVKDTVGSGVVIDKSITIDFGGYTYTFNCPVGSSGTETLGFQILAGNIVTLKNGTLTANGGTNANGKVTKVLVQNYADLTVENMSLEGNENILYCLSINSGSVEIKNSTITATDGNAAFDACKYSTYAMPDVKVENSTIVGKVEITGGDVDLMSGDYTEATFDVQLGEFTVNGGSFAQNVTEYCATGYHTVLKNGIYEYGAHTYSEPQIFRFCEEEGYIQITCPDCGNTYDSRSDKEAEIYLNENTVDLTPLRHDWTVTYSFAVDGSACTATRVCGHDNSHKETATATITSDVTTPATCEVKGKTTYTATFAEDWAEGQTLEVEDVDALDHDWTVTYSFAADGSACTATHVCGRNAEHNVTVDATAITSERTPPTTCEAKGKTTYTATFAEDWAEAQTLEVEDVDALGHDWTVTYDFADDGSACTATRVCGRNAEHNVTVNATAITSNVTTPATCEAKGKTTYTATFAEDWAEGQTLEVEDVDALDHDWTVTYDFAADGSACTATRVCGHDANHTDTATAIISSVVETPATCTEDGTTLYTATFEEAWAETQTKLVTDILKLNHDYVISYVWSENGKSCEAVRECKNDARHRANEKVSASGSIETPATCTEKGWTTYTANFTAVWATSQTLDMQDIPAIAHKNKVHHAKVDATCISEGTIEYWSCPDCNMNYSDVDCTAKVTDLVIPINSDNHATTTNHVQTDETCVSVGYTAGTFCEDCDKWISGHEEIPAIGHKNKVHHAKVDATCIASGTIEYWFCPNCNKNYSDEACTEVATDLVISLDSQNHVNTIDHEKTDETCVSIGYTAGTFCEDCEKWIEGHERISAIAHKNKVHHAKIDANCSEAGAIEYWFCPDCNKNYSDEACTDEVTEVVIPIKPDNHVNTINHGQTDETCVSVGYTAGTFCEDCEKWIAGHNEIPAIAHKNKVHHAKIDATCISEGIIEYWSCPDCSKNYSDEACTVVATDLRAFAPDNHVNTTDHVQTDATCLTVGYTAGVFCEDCDKWISGHEEIPAIAHKNKVHHAKVDATCISEGTIEYWSCPDCNKNYSDVDCTVEVTEFAIPINSDNHVNTTAHVDIPATCLTVGYTSGTYCEDCDKWIAGYEEIPAIAHKNKVYNAKVDATCVAKGTIEHWFCPDCNKNYIDEACTEVAANINIDIEPGNHKPETVEAVAPTCTESGLTEGSRCGLCGKIFVAQEIVDALGHTDGEAVYENVIEATCIGYGSYDTVVYCTVCNTERSRKYIEVEPTEIHDYIVEYRWSGTRYCAAIITCETCDLDKTVQGTITPPVYYEGDCQNYGKTVYTVTFSAAQMEMYDCLETQEKEITGAKGDHIYSYIADADVHWSKCTVCGEESSKTAHDFSAGDCICGEGKPITEIPLGIKEYDAETDSGYTVRENVVTVKYSEACAVGYLVDGEYVAIEAVKNDDGSYSFTAPEGVNEVLVVVIGDIDGDGDVDEADIDLMAGSQMPEGESLTAKQHFAADINRNGVVNSADRVWIARSLLDKTNDFYKALSW